MIQTALVIFVVYNSIDIASSQISCGQSDKNSSIWPWHVTISLVKSNHEIPPCGGTLLNDLFVITAAHCIYGVAGNKLKPSELIVTFDRPSSKRNLSIAKVIFPYEFDVHRFDNDIALIKLHRSVVFSDDVAPICITEGADAFPIGKVTIPIVTKQNNTVLTVEWDVTNYNLCHGNNRYIFNASSNHSICMGYVRSTDKFHLYRGSGLMMNKNGSWHLVGILTHAIGPDEQTPSYGGGVVVATHSKVINKIINRHLVPSISEKQCAHYNQIAKQKPSSRFSPYIALQRENDNLILHGCIGTLISERFILTAAICTNTLETIHFWLGILRMTHYTNFRSHFHPKDINRQGIAVIELDRDAEDFEYFVHCLWTDDEKPHEFLTEISHGLAMQNSRVHVQYKPDTAVTLKFKECDNLFLPFRCKPGDAFVSKGSDGSVGKIVGLLIKDLPDFGSCGTMSVLNVVAYLDWIEEVVWINEPKEWPMPKRTEKQKVDLSWMPLGGF